MNYWIDPFINSFKPDPLVYALVMEELREMGWKHFYIPMCYGNQLPKKIKNRETHTHPSLQDHFVKVNIYTQIPDNIMNQTSDKRIESIINFVKIMLKLARNNPDDLSLPDITIQTSQKLSNGSQESKTHNSKSMVTAFRVAPVLTTTPLYPGDANLPAVLHVGDATLNAPFYLGQSISLGIVRLQNLSIASTNQDHVLTINEALYTKEFKLITEEQIAFLKKILKEEDIKVGKKTTTALAYYSAAYEKCTQAADKIKIFNGLKQLILETKASFNASIIIEMNLLKIFACHYQEHLGANDPTLLKEIKNMFYAVLKGISSLENRLVFIKQNGFIFNTFNEAFEDFDIILSVIELINSKEDLESLAKWLDDSRQYHLIYEKIWVILLGQDLYSRINELQNNLKSCGPNGIQMSGRITEILENILYHTEIVENIPYTYNKEDDINKLDRILNAFNIMLRGQKLDETILNEILKQIYIPSSIKEIEHYQVGDDHSTFIHKASGILKEISPSISHVVTDEHIKAQHERIFRQQYVSKNDCGNQESGGLLSIEQEARVRKIFEDNLKLIEDKLNKLNDLRSNQQMGDDEFLKQKNLIEQSKLIKLEKGVNLSQDAKPDNLRYSVIKMDDGKLYVLYEGKEKAIGTKQSKFIDRESKLGHIKTTQCKIAQSLDTKEFKAIKIVSVSAAAPEYLKQGVSEFIITSQRFFKEEKLFSTTAQRDSHKKNPTSTNVSEVHEKKYQVQDLIFGKNVSDLISFSHAAERKVNCITDFNERLKIAILMTEELDNQFHSKGRVHRDVTLSNVVYDVESGILKFCDFDRVIQEGETCSIFGTQQFGDDEVKQERFSWKTDINALGVSFGKLLLGTSISGSDFKAEQEIKELVKLMISKNVEERPTAGEVLKKLYAIKNELSFPSEISATTIHIGGEEKVKPMERYEVAPGLEHYQVVSEQQGQIDRYEVEARPKSLKEHNDSEYYKPTATNQKQERDNDTLPKRGNKWR